MSANGIRQRKAVNCKKYRKCKNERRIDVNALDSEERNRANEGNLCQGHFFLFFYRKIGEENEISSYKRQFKIGAKSGAKNVCDLD